MMVLTSGQAIRACLFLVIVSQYRCQGIMEFCEGESMIASCDSDQVIIMEEARYGRMKMNRCVNVDYGNIGCYIDVVTEMDNWCSGRTTCEVKVSGLVDEIKNRPQVCNSDLRSYLEVRHGCVRVHQTSTEACRNSNLLPLTDSSGIIASVVAQENRGGSISCPWRISGKPGQRINITLFDFATTAYGYSRNTYDHQCNNVYATVKEGGTKNTHSICSRGVRVSHAFTSLSESAEVRMYSGDANKDKYFMLKYEIIGCATPLAPPGGVVERKDEELLLTCNNSATVQKLRCDGNQWVGDLTCHLIGVQEPEVGAVLWGFLSGSHEFSIVIIASVAIIIASSVLTVGLLCIKKARDDRAARRQHAITESEAARLYYSQSRKPDPRHEARGLPGVPVDHYYPNENDYYRTWQLQRHHPLPSLPLPPPMMSHSESGTFQGREEHIYESPKFDRREVQYHELEPSLTQGNESDSTRNSILTNSSK